MHRSLLVCSILILSACEPGDDFEVTQVADTDLSIFVSSELPKAKADLDKITGAIRYERFVDTPYKYGRVPVVYATSDEFFAAINTEIQKVMATRTAATHTIGYRDRVFYVNAIDGGDFVSIRIDRPPGITGRFDVIISGDAGARNIYFEFQAKRVNP